MGNPIRLVEDYSRDLEFPGEVIRVGKQWFWQPEDPTQGSIPVTIYNAPRPLVGDYHWTGAFASGVFYVAIDPAADTAAEYTQRTLSLDGSRLVWVPRETVEAWALEYCNEHELILADYSYDDLVRSYLATEEVV